MRRVTNCCGCLTLKIGTLVLGWITVVFTVLNVLSAIKGLGQINVVIDELRPSIQEAFPDCGLECIEIIRKTMLGVSIFSLLINLVVIAISSLLIHGVNNNRPSLMTPYLVYMYVGLVLLVVISIAASIGVTIAASIAVTIASPIVVLVFVVLMLLIIALQGYFTIVIKNCRAEMRESVGSNSMRLEEEGVAPPPYDAVVYDCKK